MSKDNFCSYCGSVVPPNVAFCPNCGSPLKGVTPPSQPSQSQIPREDQPQQPPTAPPLPTRPVTPPGPKPVQPPMRSTVPQPLTQPRPGYSQDYGEKREIPIIGTVGDGINLYLSNFFKIFIPFLVASLIARILILAVEFGFSVVGIGSLGLTIVGLVVVGIISGVLNGMVGGIVVHETSQVYLNQESDISSFDAANARKWDLFIGSIIYAVGVVIGLIALIIPGLYIMAKYALWQPAIMLESDSGNGLGRSGELTENNRWEIFGVMVILAIIQAIVTGFLDPTFFTTNIFIIAGVNSILNALVAPIPVVTATVIYYRIQGR